MAAFYFLICQVLALLYVKLYVYAYNPTYNLQQCCKNNLYSFVLCIVNCSKFVETKHK